MRRSQQAHERIALQRTLGLEVEWLSGADIDDRQTGLAPGATLGASYAPGDGYIDAPRNVLAYTAALTAHGVDVRERCAFTGLRTAGGRVVGVDTSDGPIDTERVVLTGGPQLAEVGATAGAQGSGRRHPASGGGHRAGAGSSTCTNCRWCSTSPPESIGGQANPAVCCGA